ncbi:MAG: zinc-ribbon domain-containing protein [Candidatus Bathyarchaeia archaeon]
MPYCWKCGAKLDEDTKICEACGAPVGPPSKPKRKARRPTGVLGVVAVILIVIVATAAIAAALAFLPLRTIDAKPQRHTVEYQAGVNTLSLDFTADVAHVNIGFEDLTGKGLNGEDLVVTLNASATAKVGILGSPDIFEKPWFRSNDTTVSNVVTVTSEIDVADYGWPWYPSLNVTCDIRIDHSMNVHLDIKTNVGRILMDTQAGVVLNSLRLEATTGGVKAKLVEDVVITNDVSVKTTTGGIELSWDNVIVPNDVQVYVKTTTGGVDINVKQNKRMSRDVALKAEATTGGVDFALDIQGNIGAKIESSVTTGGINIARQVGFSGTKSLLHSDNYPADSNFDVSLKTTTGGIQIYAKHTP